ncbi:hypothetical protein F0L74_00290 [Chitinophaga agrisoli]|uniref:Lipoprotein n=1 Tax=Chitinophaga agrisoli TaxID=2607653 RepID=A0A5B2W1W1_9BACT|nr:DUF6452 family protein [Chitinophaga agrisoli]KAA2244457.1 hypothetical protein F0L74_00290 [Chitinophaga agrisoli]
MKYFIFLLLIAAVACSDETKFCDQALSTDTHMRFIRDSLGFRRDTIMSKVTLYALGRDSIYKQQAVSDVFFALSPVADSSRFYLKVDSISDPDTLTFRYSRSQHFISPGCGFSTFFSLDTVITTQHTIQSLLINQKDITSTTNDTAHITLYFGF